LEVGSGEYSIGETVEGERGRGWVEGRLDLKRDLRKLGMIYYPLNQKEYHPEQDLV
jgi:hypothetical protein